MASKNNGGFDLEESLGILIVAWVIAPPLGLILTALAIISRLFGSKDGSSSRFSAAKAREKFNQKLYGTPVAPSDSATVAQKTSSPAEKKTVKRNIGARVMSVLGWAALAVAAVTAIIGIPKLFSSAWFTEVLPTLLLFALPAGALIVGGNRLKKRDERLARIKLLIGNRESCDLAKLAAVSGTNIRRTRRDVQKLIDKGEFGDKAYIDLGTNNFMRTPDAKPEITLNESKKPSAKKKGDTAREDDLGMKTDNGDFKSVIREIRRLNDEIKDEAVSERIYKIESHTKNIFDYVSAHPEKMPQIRTFMSYYLPTTLKLLESYSRIEKVGVAGENMKKSKENIESTLDALEVAFRMQIDDLFASESIDISSDISVLETMMSKDGLTEKKDFDLGGTAAQGE